MTPLLSFRLAQQRYQVEGTATAAALALTEQGDVLRIAGSSMRRSRPMARRLSWATSHSRGSC